MPEVSISELGEMLVGHRCETGFKSECRRRKQLTWCVQCIARELLQRVAERDAEVKRLRETLYDELGEDGMAECAEEDQCSQT